MQQSLDEEADRGLLPGINAKDWLNAYWDPRDDFKPEKRRETDATWARETAAGVELRRHPEIEMLQRPWLWRSIQRFRSGVRREITAAEHDTWSNMEVECWGVLVEAEQREHLRRQPPPGGATP